MGRSHTAESCDVQLRPIKPGLWSASGPLSRGGCRPVNILVTRPNHSSMIFRLRRSCSTFRASRISHLHILSRSVAPSVLRERPASAACSWEHFFGHYSMLATIGDGRSKDRFKNSSFAVLENRKTPFCDHETIKLTQNHVSFTNPCTNLHVPFSVTCEYHPKAFELLDLLQCIAAYLQHGLTWISGETSVFLALILALAWSHAAANRSSACWRPYSEAASSTESCAKRKLSTLQLTTYSWLGCECTFNSNRLWMQRSGDSTNPCRSPTPTVNGCDLTAPTRSQTSEQGNTVNWRPATGGRQHRTPATLYNAFLK